MERQELLDAARNVVQKLNRTPTRAEFVRFAGIPESQFLEHFRHYREFIGTATFPGKQKILDAAQAVAKKLGRSPTRDDFKRYSRIPESQFLRHFPNYRELIRAAGLEPYEKNIKLTTDDLLKDWGEVVRRLGRIPLRKNYGTMGKGKYTPSAFRRHWKRWLAVPLAFRRFAQGKSEWADVLAVVPLTPQNHGALSQLRTTDVAHSENASLAKRNAALEKRATYGDPIDFRGLRHEPLNEQGVVFLFGMVAIELGYMVEAVRTGYPDCEAKRKLKKGGMEHVKIEFEFRSSNFVQHKHDASKCDQIVCWIHDWWDCPKTIEVVELSKVLKSLAQSND